MAYRRQSTQRIYVDDDIPGFMKTGPSDIVLKEAKKHGLVSPKAPALSSEDAPLGSTIYFDPDKEETSPSPEIEAEESNSPFGQLSRNGGWDQHFMLTIVLMLVLLNTALFIGFHPSLTTDSNRLTLINRNYEEYIPKSRLEDRVVTYRSQEPTAAEVDAAEPADESLDYQYVPMMP